MADCECLPKCPFFHDRMANMPAVASLLKTSYCKGDARSCARYQVFKALGPGKAPVDLYPNQIERVKAVIQAGR
jgi:hypothetical protein